MNCLRMILSVALCLAAGLAAGQDLRYTLFNNTPLIVNPALAGSFDGAVRGSLNHRRGWSPVSPTYVSYNLSADGRVLNMKNGDRLGVGGQLGHDEVGDGYFKNNTAAVSVAYHKVFAADSATGRGCSLSFGVQGTYVQQSIYLALLYFNGELSPMIPGIGYGYAHEQRNVDAGLAFSHALNGRFNYTVGVKVGNISEPNDALMFAQVHDVGLDRYYQASAGCNISVAGNLWLRPAALYISRRDLAAVMLGNEFLYQVPAGNRPLGLFAGAWYRTGDMVAVSAGINTGIVRISASYDYALSTLMPNLNRGFEIGAGFVPPTSSKKIRHVICDRF